MQLQSIADHLVFSTFALTAVKNGIALRTGTGFFFEYQGSSANSFAPVLVTNKHVVKGADTIRFRINVAKTDGSFVKDGAEMTVDLASDLFLHPDDAIDLCVIRMSYLVGGQPHFSVALGEENLPADGDWSSFDTVEDVWMVGCPNGIYDKINLLPIVRSGITASSPRLNYQGKPEFVVDMACFPGSSGSPIFRRPGVARFDRQLGGVAIGGEDRLVLMGILYGGPLITTDGKIVLSSTPRVEVASMMHLGYAIRSTCLLDIKPQVIQ